MAKLLPLIILLVAAVAGGGGGYFLKMSQAPAVTEEDEEAHDDEHGDKKDKKSKKDKKKGGHKKDGEGSSSGYINYLKFSRQFVIPILKDGTPELLMVLDIKVEMDSSFSDNAYSAEPRLRDAMLKELFYFASNGTLSRVTEDSGAMEEVKEGLLETIRSIIGDSPQQVLFTDIGLQYY